MIHGPQNLGLFGTGGRRCSCRPLPGAWGIKDSRLPGTHVPGYIPPSLRDYGISSNRNAQPLISHHSGLPGWFNGFCTT